MTQCTEVWVSRNDLRDTRITNTRLPAPAEGEVLVAIDRFALTSNNVSYAVSGDNVGYWGYFPADDGWGKVPVWGCANVIESGCPEVPVGERIWGAVTERDLSLISILLRMISKRKRLSPSLV